ncbi:MAG: hypothetical protein HON76_00890 [Candidatus Scalindua sp.]|jgi:hypothetical protein|nr:hypothetical protein [Candidatus Scalindua sp.]MBT5306963.1 hypothetical protein [Candidatus Scalindua sp.]MBT6227500.1 hypothetical protein [Candidatus Scalindua sp.]MBT6561068.1 hypothetical protein [Candidatus Scalindua sp.]MBT7212924.1 hypothetical protein [Candidatus Scalindua sp.]
MSKVEENRDKSSWHRHPLLVAVVSILLLGTTMEIVKSNLDDKSLLRKKQISLISDMALLNAKYSIVFRSINNLAVLEDEYEKNENKSNELQAKAQDAIDDAYLLAAQFEAQLAIYFPGKNGSDAFYEFRISTQNKISEGINVLQELNSPGKIFSREDYDFGKLQINNIVQTMFEYSGLKL